ncbi:bifunctional AP-4-A phosphorylase/ADP sulfurylase [Tulasnella sp. 403]|nr:bifunctional AP-4-A phosphorylase/ADP sulfurylase [Tulasnella sp. 403]
MGHFIWNQWARFVSITASVYLVWAGFWGLFFRKFFWDFVSGVRMNTPTQKGIIPGASAAPFIAVIVTVPLVQILSMIIGTFMILLEYPAPFMKGTPVYRSWVVRIVLLVIQGFLAALFYQGTNAAIWSAIAAFGYTMAQMRGEIHEEAQQNFEVRLCPSLSQKKPAVAGELEHAARGTGDRKEHNPFLPPYAPGLYIGELDEGDEAYVALLNKYCVVEQHFLLVVKEYKLQTSPLTPDDLTAAYRLLSAAKEQGRHFFMFYNCGERSGSSQKHKHMQFIPMSNADGPPIERLAKLQVLEAEGKAFSIPHLKYSHHVMRLPQYSPARSPDEMGHVLSQAYITLLDLTMKSFLHESEANSTHRPGPPAYNVLLTLEHLHMIPRIQADHLLSDGSEIPVNTLGFAGMLMVKSEKDRDALIAEGVMNVLKGFTSQLTFRGEQVRMAQVDEVQSAEPAGKSKPTENRGKKSQSAELSAYLYLYNIYSAAAWFYPLLVTVLHLMDVRPAFLDPYLPVLDPGLAAQPHKRVFDFAPSWALPVLHRATTTYALIGPAVKYIQTAAVLEVFHSLLGWVRSPLQTTMMQVASRLVLVWGVADNYPSTHVNPIYTSMVLSWSITEVIRYSYYACSVIGREPYLLLWLRYTTFYVLYLTGAGSEAFLMFSTLPVTTWPPNYNVGSWTWDNYVCATLYAIWWPSLYMLYTYMVKQRRRVLGGASKKTASIKKTQ